MFKIVRTKKETLQEVLHLINHVFGKENEQIKMENIFSDLLCEANMDHMWVIWVDDKPVSVVNYLINEVEIYGCRMKTASIGAVCTHEDHRHRGYSSMILKECLQQMKEEGVALLYVSGDIALYTRNSIHLTGRMFEFGIGSALICESTSKSDPLCHLRVCDETEYPLLSSIYKKEAVRFVRSEQTCVDLLKRNPGAAVFNQSSQVYAVEENSEIQGYFVCAVIPNESSGSLVNLIEYAGRRDLIVSGMMLLMEQMQTAQLDGYTMWYDQDMIKALQEKKIDMEPCHLPGTIKILDFSAFLSLSKPYWQQIEGFAIDVQSVEEHDQITTKEGTISGISDQELHDLLLGNAERDALLPIPYPYGLNYI